MGTKLILSFLAMVFFNFNCVNAKSLTLCPNENLANELVGAAKVDAPAEEATGLIRRVRLPQFGLYNHYLNCILITDTSYDDGNDSQVEIVDGGLYHNYVEIRLASDIGKGLDYNILAYTNRGDVDLNNTYVKYIPHNALRV